MRHFLTLISLSLFSWASVAAVLRISTVADIDNFDNGGPPKAGGLTHAPNNSAAAVPTHHAECDAKESTLVWGHAAGFGSKLNNLVSAWLYVDQHGGKQRIGLGNRPPEIFDIHCTLPGGAKGTGWNCIFEFPLTSFCYISQGKIPRTGFVEARKWMAGQWDAKKRPHGEIFLEKAQVMAEIWRRMHPELRHQVEQARDHSLATLQNEAGGHSFAALHIRRGDKLKEHTESLHAITEYLVAAKDAAHKAGLVVDGLFVSSDDPSVTAIVKKHAATYFPEVAPERVTSLESHVPVSPPPHTRMSMDDLGALLAEVEVMAAAPLWVGTFSSNIGRVTSLLREGVYGKDRQTSVSLDWAWDPS